jgi:hypothetical protein
MGAQQHGRVIGKMPSASAFKKPDRRDQQLLERFQSKQAERKGERIPRCAPLPPGRQA